MLYVMVAVTFLTCLLSIVEAKERTRDVIDERISAKLQLADGREFRIRSTELSIGMKGKEDIQLTSPGKAHLKSETSAAIIYCEDEIFYIKNNTDTDLNVRKDKKEPWKNVKKDMIHELRHGYQIQFESYILTFLRQ